ncbi:unnamed protein product [Chilo suppressalis]|uniref:MADF domain-containing protein n=1 Tax=Chilo suppressalis TaxID=168631 RepID=A0ABN8B952_CHISP|nr:unnamed protein product [Chilo suppressalis]
MTFTYAARVGFSDIAVLSCTEMVSAANFKRTISALDLTTKRTACASFIMTTWVLDPELLIMEVESRPLLYVKSLPEYANKLLKNDSWEEIASKLSFDWESLEKGEKNKRCKEVQAKWKHIRDNFRREYQAQRDVTSGQGAKKRKKYRYYDQLLFLVPHVKDAPISGNYTAASNDSEQTESNVENTDNTLSVPPASPQQIKKRKKENTMSTFEEEVLKSIRNDKAEPDEDTSFCLSLNNQPYLRQPQQFSQVSQPSSISMNQPHATIELKSVHPSNEIKILEQYQYFPPITSTSTSTGNNSRPQCAQSYFSQFVPVPSPSPTDTSSSSIVLCPLTNVTASSPEEYLPTDTYSQY